MANFVRNGSQISRQRLTLVPGRWTRLGLYGPMNLFAKPPTELAVVSDPAAGATTKKSSEPIANDIQIWIIKGNQSGISKIQAKPEASAPEVWDWIEIDWQPTSATADQEAFFNKLAEDGGDTARKYKLPVSIMIAQACEESGYGQHQYAKSYNILYGITKRQALSQGKEPDWYPACKKIVKLSTQPEAGAATQPDLFCSASSYQEAVEIWAQYVTKHPHNKRVAHLYNGGPWTEKQLTAIADGMTSMVFGKGSPNYGQELMKIVTANKLTQFD
jgi:Mannosyl-glycoprotein endo-beta-N-acetylglucosaminidase